jgi:hypothetical protein
MSTLVKMLLALVLHVVHVGDIPNDDGISKTETVETKYTVQELNPHFIITRDELLSQINETEI